MSPASQRASSEAGFTLVELMMALVIFSIAVAGILSVAVSLTNGFREQRQAINAQDAVRSPIDLVADALRQLSPGVGAPNELYDTTVCSRGAISVIPSTTGPDTLDIVYASGGVVSTALVAVDVNGSAIPNITLPTGAGVNFAVNDYVMVTDFDSGHVLKVTSVTGDVLAFAAHGCGTTFNNAYTPLATLVRVQHARFTVADDTTNNNMPTLWMDADGLGSAFTPEPLAEGIEDMQIAVGVDLDNSNGVVDAVTATATDDWLGNHASDPVLDLAVHTPRAVRVTMIARTTKAQAGNQNTYSRPAAEDRPAASANDQYRRRMLRTVVELRNISGSK